MAGTINKVILIGHTGGDVKMTYFEGGGSIGRFSLATNEEYINKSTNERIVNTEWHNIVVRNKGAEICEKYLKKGDKVYIEGRLKTRKWQDDKGVDRYSTEIQCLDFTFLTSKPNKPEITIPNSAENTTNTSTSTPDINNNQGNEDDLPF